MAIVKADAYGHGAVPVATALGKSGAGWLGVATVDEGLELREAGIRTLILSMGYCAPERAGEILEHRIIPTIMAIEDAHAFSKAVGNAVLPVHLKVDSGMCRMGVRHDRIEKFCRQVKDLSNLYFEGIFSHFAAPIDDVEFSRHQIANFDNAVAEAERILGPFKWKHICSSPGIPNYEQAHYNMVRPGELLYGMDHALQTQHNLMLKPAMTLKARLATIKSIEPGDTVGYSRTYCSNDPQDVGLVTIGYADGYPRQLSNKADVIIRGRRYPLVGLISMDTLTVGLGVGNDCRPGDEVVLLGAQGAEQVTAEELAPLAGTCPHAIVTGFGKRLHRIHRGHTA
jgi:alanine racemase